jgi:hypothetical protein
VDRAASAGDGCRPCGSPAAALDDPTLRIASPTVAWTAARFAARPPTRTTTPTAPHHRPSRATWPRPPILSHIAVDRVPYAEGNS